MKKYEVQLSWVYNVTLDAENEEDACEKAEDTSQGGLMSAT